MTVGRRNERTFTTIQASEDNARDSSYGHADEKRPEETPFEFFVVKYEKPLINYLYRYLNSLHDAEDVAQRAFIKTYLNIRKCPTPEAMGGYLYRTATNAALNILRRKRIVKIFSFAGLARSAEDGDDEAHIGENLPDTGQKTPDDAYAESQKQKRVRRALASLPHEQKTSLILSFYDDKSYAEIAAIIGKSVSAVESLIFRAKQNLAEILKDIER
ncbi:MAG: RNA polymerase sigma factor [Endomicrobiia bacterium]|nr:RNA polymerase sigma factor [Endomicrobiia bacterium]